MINGVRGLVNNNPLNVKVNPGVDTWEGQIGHDDLGHAIFSDPVFSVRACLITMANYQRRGKHTLRQIFETYAPESDGNQPNRYAAFVGKRVGLDIDVQVKLFSDEDGRIWNKDFMKRFIAAMLEMEVFAGYQLSEETILSGIAYYEYSRCK